MRKEAKKKRSRYKAMHTPEGTWPVFLVTRRFHSTEHSLQSRARRDLGLRYT